MTTISHKTLSGTQLHENKGVSAATIGQVATADGAGNTVWQLLTTANLTGTGNPFGAQLLHVRDERSNGTGGTSLVATTWTTVVLNTVKTNQISSATLVSNQLSLPAGTYRARATAVSGFTSGSQPVGSLKLRLRNITAGSTLATGPFIIHGNAGSVNGSGNAFGSLDHATFTLGVTSTIELQGWSSFPSAPSGATSGEVEVYAEVEIWKIA